MGFPTAGQAGRRLGRGGEDRRGGGRAWECCREEGVRLEHPSGKLIVLRRYMIYISGFCVFSKPSAEGSENFLSCPHPFNLLVLEKASLP